MTVRNPPVWLQGGTYSAEHDRLVTGMLTDRNTNAAGTLLGLEGGIVPPLDQMRAVASGNNDMVVNITSGVAVVPRLSIDPPGAYICHNQGTATLTFPPAASAARIDLIVARVYDAQQGEVGNVWALERVPGTESSSPVTPTAPGTSIKIAAVRVIPAAQNGGANKIATSQITDQRVFTTGVGGTHLTWGNPNPTPSPGRFLYDVPNKSLWIGNGATFDPMFSLVDIKAYFASYRPRMDYRGTNVSTSADATWDPLIRDDAADPVAQMTTRIQVGHVSSPSGQLKVTISANGRGTSADTYANLSYQVRRNDTNGLVGTDNAYGKGPSFFSTQWATGQVTTITQVPEDIDCSVVVFFAKSGTGSGRAEFRRVRLIVEPVL